MKFKEGDEVFVIKRPQPDNYLKEGSHGIVTGYDKKKYVKVNFLEVADNTGKLKVPENHCGGTIIYNIPEYCLSLKKIINWKQKVEGSKKAKDI